MYHFSRLPIPLFSGYRCIHTKIEDVVTQLNLERPCIGLLRERDSALPFLHRLGIQSPLEIKFPLTLFPTRQTPVYAPRMFVSKKLPCISCDKPVRHLSSKDSD